MIKTSSLLFLSLLLINGLNAQKLSGHLKNDALQKFTLFGYKGFDSFILGSAKLDSSGRFTIDYPEYSGMGYLKTEANDKTIILLVLNEDSIFLKGTSLSETSSLETAGSKENKTFKRYAVEHNKRISVLTAWKYLQKQYDTSHILKNRSIVISNIDNEIKHLETEDSVFLKHIDTSLYISRYLPIRKLIDEMPASAMHYPERIPQNIDEFRQINFKDKWLYNSGLTKNLLRLHYWLIENAGLSLDSMYKQMNISTDYIIDNLQGDDSLLNKFTQFLFNLMEQRSLFKASEYLALKMLTQNSCMLNEKLSNELETYRIMKVGNIAPDIAFNKGSVAVKGRELKNDTLSLSGRNHKATLVVFGASWCPKCRREIPVLTAYYDRWKAKGINIIFISLDQDKKSFLTFTKDYPWISYCDFQGWDGKAVNDYHVFATPTMFLLDNNRRILVRPVSAQHANVWIEQKL